MSFHITGLDPTPFKSLFVDDAELAARGGRRVTATQSPGFPCRVSLADASVGEELVLLPFEHHPTSTPYRGSGPIFIRRNAIRFDDHSVPDAFRSRTMSVRAYDANGDMVVAEVCPGTELEPVIERLLDRSKVAYLHVHFAAPGCFACRVDRA